MTKKNAFKYSLAALSLILAAPALSQLKPKPEIDDQGTIVVPSFKLPFSSIASEEAMEAFRSRMEAPRSTPSMDLSEVRKNTDKQTLVMVNRAKEIFPMKSVRTMIGGVPVEIFEPADGISDANRDRVLIEMHGGAFVAGGGGIGGAIESIPIAGEGKIKVIAVDYRLAPEHRFPAASEDVATVYREVIKDYKPENIGLFGCSAGGTLAAQSIAWFLKEDLPLPGAIGVFCSSLLGFGLGDSTQLWPRLGSVIPFVRDQPKDVFGPSSAYLAGQRVDDPLVNPGSSDEVLKKFPPTLLLTGTRAPEMSAAAESAVKLQELGIESQLSLFDGLDHGFISNPDLPESRRAYRLIWNFFDEHLGGGNGSTDD
ncbi:MAG: alpha/beta hydrolase fold domain-containing protein [Novosphingobium sp.]|nr:alpha/beta hydrolase fold domain-containing protein [Novosphingobium sp.]